MNSRWYFADGIRGSAQRRDPRPLGGLHGANVVVLSRGMAECLRVPRETIDFLKERRIEAHILPTTQAAELYNRLAKEGPVGGLFHTTC